MFCLLFNEAPQAHEYLLSSVGTGMKDSYYNTRKEAESAMNTYCQKRGISVECVECDRHERAYAGSNGSEFYINRV